MTTWVLSGAALVVAGTAYRFVSGVWHAVAIDEADRHGVRHALAAEPRITAVPDLVHD